MRWGAATLIFCATGKMTEQATKGFLATADVLLIEHSTHYADLAARAIRDTCPETSIDVVTTCEQALYYFFRAGEYADRDSTSPRLILLNVAPPGIGSLEVLERIKRDRVGCMIPVVAVTLTMETDLVQLFCSKGASSFVAAPIDPHQYMVIMRQVANYWLNINLSPRKTN
jgi:CheY-like chemotaxis protein